MNAFNELINNAFQIEAKLGYQFSETTLLALAFVHCSYINEHREVANHNERLEFLGDSVLGLLVADFLYKRFPDLPEGELSTLRSRLVDSNTCMNFVIKLDVHRYLLLGRGEKLNDGRGRESILGDLFEAIMGAIYLDGGIEAARKFLFDHFTNEIHAIIDKPLSNWKAIFQDFCQKSYQQPPKYTVQSEIGPDHSKIFKIVVEVNGQEQGVGQGGSKKEAQQDAAHDALKRLKLAD